MAIFKLYRFPLKKKKRDLCKNKEKYPNLKDKMNRFFSLLNS